MIKFKLARAAIWTTLLTGAACTEANPYQIPVGSSTSTSTAETTSTPQPETDTEQSTTEPAAETSSSGSSSITVGSGEETATSGGLTTSGSSEGTSTGSDITCTVDGIVDGGEECDDDNAFDNDGCTACVVDADFVCFNAPSLCVPACDPLLQDCEVFGYGCYPIAPAWGCAPDASGGDGQAGDPCGYPNVCDPGLICLDAGFFADCAVNRDFDGCCSELCDLDAPYCPGTGGCTPYYEPGDAPDGLEHLGFCDP
jgi:hypothetical protein